MLLCVDIYSEGASLEKNKDMKLSMLVTSLDGGGAEKVASELSLKLNSNINYILTTIKEGVSYDVKNRPLSMKLKLDTDLLFLKKINYLFIILKGSIKYRKLINAYDPDISLSFLTLDNFINIISSFRRKKTKTIISQHAVLKKEYSTSSILDGLLHILIRFMYYKADVVIAVSNGVKKELINYYKVNPKKIKVIYNPVDLNKIIMLSKKNIDKEFTINDDYKILFNMGRFVKSKGQWHLIRAFTKVSKQKKCKLVMCGDGELKTYLKLLVKCYDLENEVLFLGWRKNPFRYLSRSTIMISSSLWESFGLGLIEAMACGCPVIATDCIYGPSEILDNGKYGVLVPNMDGNYYTCHDVLTKEENYLADKIMALLDDDSLRHEYIRKGKKRVNKFGLQSVKQYEKVFLDLCN